MNFENLRNNLDERGFSEFLRSEPIYNDDSFRTAVINSDEILNLKILLNTTSSVDEFLSKI